MKIQNDTLWKKSFKILLQENVLVYCISILKVTFLGHPVVDVGDLVMLKIKITILLLMMMMTVYEFDEFDDNGDDDNAKDDCNDV